MTTRIVTPGLSDIVVKGESATPDLPGAEFIILDTLAGKVEVTIGTDGTLAVEVIQAFEGKSVGVLRTSVTEALDTIGLTNAVVIPDEAQALVADL